MHTDRYLALFPRTHLIIHRSVPILDPIHHPSQSAQMQTQPANANAQNHSTLLKPAHFHPLISTRSTPPTDPDPALAAAVPDCPYTHAPAESAPPHTALHTRTRSGSAAAPAVAAAAHSPVARSSGCRAAASLHSWCCWCCGGGGEKNCWCAGGETGLYVLGL
jgi:hypothetical protein